jgi:hypothetical protein
MTSTTYRGWRVVLFPIRYRLDINVLRHSGYRLATQSYDSVVSCGCNARWFNATTRQLSAICHAASAWGGKQAERFVAHTRFTARW